MLIALEDVTIQLGRRAAFAHTTWRIAPGQHWAVLGPSGAGKTVLAQALARRLPLTGGQITYFFDDPAGAGRPYLYPSEVLTFSGETHRAFLARYAGYHQARWQSFEGEDAPTLSALLESGGRLSTSGKTGRLPFEVAGAEEAPAGAFTRAELVDLLGLASLLERRVHQLSHGESRKALLARLLLRVPQLLILDDPFAGLDAATRARLSEAFERLLERPRPALLFITARAAELPAGATHLLEVCDLRVAGQGPRAEVAPPPEANLAQEEAPAPGAAQPLPGALAERLAGYAAALGNPGPDQAELVRMQGVTVAYPGVTVLDQVDWTVRRGERWALLGPNGAGKTTLLSLILADNPQAYRNRISLFGQPRGSGESIWEIKRQTGWVSPELHAFYDPSATALEVVLSGFYDSVGLHAHSTPAQREAAAAWLDALGAGGDPRQTFAGLSAGQQRLVLLARALVKHPPLLVLDEPCQGLDAAQRARFLGFIEALCAHTPLALIYVTHDRGELPAAVTHELRLEKGKVVFTQQF